MKFLIPTILSLVFATVGFFAGMQYEMSKQTYKAEEVIGKEIAILEQYKGVPDCAQAQASVNQLNADRTSGAIVVWVYDQSGDMLKRVVINRGFDTVYEELNDYCQAK